jgi:hypothetical protein
LIYTEISNNSKRKPRTRRIVNPSQRTFYIEEIGSKKVLRVGDLKERERKVENLLFINSDSINFFGYNCIKLTFEIPNDNILFNDIKFSDVFIDPRSYYEIYLTKDLSIPYSPFDLPSEILKDYLPIYIKQSNNYLKGIKTTAKVKFIEHVN